MLDLFPCWRSRHSAANEGSKDLAPSPTGAGNAFYSSPLAFVGKALIVCAGLNALFFVAPLIPVVVTTVLPLLAAILMTVMDAITRAGAGRGVYFDDHGGGSETFLKAWGWLATRGAGISQAWGSNLYTWENVQMILRQDLAWMAVAVGIATVWAIGAACMRCCRGHREPA